MSVSAGTAALFQAVIETGVDGSLVEALGVISKSPTTLVVQGKRINHFNVHQLPAPRLAARWHNALQRLAEDTLLGIPVTVSTDPRHAFHKNSGVSFAAGHFSQWPDMLTARVPVVLDVNLDRPAILTPLVDLATAIVGTYGTYGPALADALSGAVRPEGRLPFQLPRSMDAVRASRPDVPSDTPDPVCPAGHGLSW